MAERRALTLLELVAVLAIGAVMLGLLLPAVQQAREAANQVSCRNRMRQIGISLHHYADQFGCFPPGSQVADYRTHRYSKSFGWTIMVLPFLDQKNLYDSFDFNGDAQHLYHRNAAKNRIPVMECPSDPASKKLVRSSGPAAAGLFAPGSYLGVSGTNALLPSRSPDDCWKYDSQGLTPKIQTGVLFGNSATRLADVMDGTSHTLLLGERGVTQGLGRWAGPGEFYRCPWGLSDVVLPGTMDFQGILGGVRKANGSIHDRYSWWSLHRGGVHVVFCDGSARFLSEFVSRELVTTLATRAGQDVANVEF